MSRKIKATYTADPTAGNDPAKGYLIAGDDGEDEPVVLDMDQLAGVMGGKLGIDIPPDPPPPDPDDEDVNQLVITIQDNTLQANIRAISGMTYTHHLILRDDDTDVTYPTGGTWSNLAVPALVTLTDWTDEIFYVWVYNLSTGVTKEILDPNGVSGVTVAPNDTIGPDWTTGSFSIVANSGNPNSQIDYTIVAPTDAGTGLAASATYDIITDIEDSPSSTIKLGFTALTGTITVPPGTHNWQCVARDESGNSSLSDVDSVTITGAGAGGTIGFTATSFGSADEEGDTIAITLERSGGTTTATVDVSTIDDTAISAADFNYTEIDGQTVTWTNGDNTDKTVDLTTADQSSTYNNQCFIVIDYGSETGTETAVDVPSCRAIINSSNETGIAGFQQDESSDELLVIEAENYDLSVTGANSDTWAKIGPNSRFSPAGGNGLAINVPETSDHYGEHTELDPTAPYTEFDVNYTSSTTTAHVWIRAAQQTGSNGERIHVTLLRPIASIGIDGSGGSGECRVTTTEDHSYSNGDVISLDGTTAHDGTYTITDASGSVFDIPNQGESSQGAIGGCLGDPSGVGLHHDGGQPTEIYTWQHEDENPVDRTLEFPATGAWKLRTYVREPDYKWDKIVLTTNGSYDPTEVGTVLENIASVDYYEGPDESSQIPGGGAPVDNPDNTVDLPVPIPTDTTTDGVLVPIDGATGVTTTTEITMTFANMTELEVNSHEVTTGGSPISSTLTSTANSLKIEHNPLINGNTYTVTIDARIRDTDGVVKQVAVASPPWTFTVIDIPDVDPNVILLADFEGIASTVPHTLTVSEMETAFDTSNTGGSERESITSGSCVLVDDPADSSRGHVLRVRALEGNYGLQGGSGYRMQKSFASTLDEVYYSLEIYIPIGYDWAYNCKLGGPLSSPSFQQIPANIGKYVSANLVMSGIASHEPTSLPQCTVNGGLRLYRYDAQGIQDSWYCVSDTPTSPPTNCTSTSANYMTMEPGRWHRIVAHVKRNTVGVDNGIAQVWLNGDIGINRSTVRWRSTVDSGLGFDRAQPQLYHGGGGSKYAPPQTQYLYFNNWTISENVISP